MVPKIFQGDDTDANGRTVAIQLPDEDMSGFRMRFEFLGRTFEFDELPRGGSVRVDFDADDTALFPLGTHYGTIRLQKNGRWHTVSNTVPVTVSDEVVAVYGGDASAIHLEMQFCGGIPDLTGVNDSPANANELARAFKALLDALKSAPRSLGMLALAFCMSAFGASARLSVQSAPLGEVAFSSRVVTGVEFDESGLVTSNEITDVVRESQISDVVREWQLKSMAWTNENFKTAVEAVSPRVELPTDIVNSVNGQTGAVVLNAYNIPYNDDGDTIEEAVNGLAQITVPHLEDFNNPHNVTAAQVGAYTTGEVDGKLAAKADEFSGWSFSGNTNGYDLSLEYAGGTWTLYHLGFVDLASEWADKDATRLVFELGLDLGTIVATRGRVLYSGDPSMTAAFDAWRTNDNQVALGNSSTVSASKGMAIGLKTTTGRTTIAAGASSIAFGIGAQTAPAGAAAIAFGANATANASSAVQIGQGVNSEAETLQFRSYRLLNADGTIPAERLGSSVTAETVTNVVERVRDLIYDEKRNITWRRVMYDGNLYYVAVTNANIVAEED